MKCIVALFAVFAVASAGLIASPLAYSNWGVSPLASTWAAPLAAPYAASYAAPYAASYAAPYAAAYAAPVAAIAPIARTVAVAPAIQSGYVAATRGSVHTAPLPQGPHAFSHHINTAPAPGTW